MSDYKIKNNEFSFEVTYKDKARLKVYQILPGIYFSFNEIHTFSLPIMSGGEMELLYTINYGIQGNCGVHSVNDKYIYLRAGEIMLSKEQAAKSFEYPTGEYIGLEIGITREALAYQALLQEFQIHIEHIASLYLQGRDQTVIFENCGWLKNALNDMAALYEKNIVDISLLRLHTLYILRGMTAGLISCRPGYEGALTKGQVDIAKSAKNILMGDLTNKITIADVARNMGISATSLKNYFKAIYGKNISDYRQELRIEKAKELLLSTQLPICDIAGFVGFETQSKFTALFHEKVGVTPSEFRRKRKKDEENSI